MAPWDGWTGSQMTNLLRISEAASMAIHTVALLAADPARVATTGEVAMDLSVSEAHLSKVLQRLAKEGLVKSVRGPKGGFILGKPANEIRLLDVFEAIEGRLEPADCLLEKPVCSGCIMGDLLHKVNTLVREQLSNTRVSDVASLVTGGHHA
jgi:Rrf2 family protein